MDFKLNNSQLNTKVQVISLRYIALILLWLLIPVNSFFAEEKTTQKPLKIGFVKNNIPFSFSLPDGTPAGLYVEFWQLWSKQNNIPISIHIDGFERIIKAVKNKELDFHSGLFINQERERWSDFSIPIHSVKTGILYRDTSSKAAKLESMKGKTVSAHVGSFQATYIAENYPEINLVYYDDSKTVINQLFNNEIQAIVSEVPYIKAQLARLGLTGVFTLADEELLTNQVHAAVAKGQSQLLEMINKGIQNIPVEQIIHLEKKWLPNLKPFFKNTTSFPGLSIKEQQWLDAHSQISLGIDPYWQPFEFIDNDGNYKGIVADYVSYTSQQLGISINHAVTSSWSEAFEAFKSKKIDVMGGIVKTEERSKYMLFTDSMISLPTIIVTNKNSFYVSGLESLNNKILGAVEGYVFVELISSDYPDITIKTFSSITEGLDALQDGRVDGFIDAIATINFELERTQAEDLVVYTFSPYTLDLSMGIHKEWQPLVAILNKVFASMSVDEKSAIANKWLSVHVQQGTNLSTIFLWVTPIASLMLLVIFVIVRTNRRMESEIIERKKVEKFLEIAKEAAEMASKAKGDFLANMSHEIRTPMNAVVGMSYLLEETGLTPTQQGFLNTLNASTSTLLLLINDILDMSKIEAGKLDLESHPFLLKQIMTNIRSQAEVQIDHSKVTFEDNIDPLLPKILLGDSLRLGQILLNLTSNAIKFTKEGTIKISVVQAEKLGNVITLLFSITDTGIGMTDAQVRRLFKTYSQADTSTTRKYGGTGLGLAISKSLCELMDGEIWVYSELGKGSGFHFSAEVECLDDDDPRITNFKQPKITTLVEQREPKPVEWTESKYKLSGKRILVVDDNSVNLMIAKKVLIKEGVIVTTASNGKESLKAIENHVFDAVLMDIQMPIMDGYTATKKIREIPAYKNLPIIALSANVMKEHVDKAIEVGMNTHLSKPLDVKKLLNTLETFTNLSS